MAMTLGALLAAIAVTAGAFGAHGLAERLDARALELWETGARYLLYGGLGAFVAGLARRAGVLAEGSAGNAAPWLLAAGAGLFAMTLFAMALGAPGWLGAITPIGGAAMIAGFLALAWAAWQASA
ncbi:MAG: DUF423 domain-containing protein [Acidobacteria bacterium]|nr:MAG: DUF423 domain-containing protein [Acidobacteriota bacterium]REK09723.1 MAG: DUF423 domain-containing protein [Acidobacteriota bacterium]